MNGSTHSQWLRSVYTRHNNFLLLLHYHVKTSCYSCEDASNWICGIVNGWQLSKTFFISPLVLHRAVKDSFAAVLQVAKLQGAKLLPVCVPKDWEGEVRAQCLEMRMPPWQFPCQLCSEMQKPGSSREELRLCLPSYKEATLRGWYYWPPPSVLSLTAEKGKKRARQLYMYSCGPAELKGLDKNTGDQKLQVGDLKETSVSLKKILRNFLYSSL